MRKKTSPPSSRPPRCSRNSRARASKPEKQPTAKSSPSTSKSVMTSLNLKKRLAKRAADLKYRHSPKGLECSLRFSLSSPARRESQRLYDRSPLGQERHRRYRQNERTTKN